MSDLLSVGTSACSRGVFRQVRKMARIIDEGGLRIDEDSPNIVRKWRFVAGDRARRRSSNEGLRRIFDAVLISAVSRERIATVVPAKAGTHFDSGSKAKMDSGLRRNDGKVSGRHSTLRTKRW